MTRNPDAAVIGQRDRVVTHVPKTNWLIKWAN